MLRWNMLDDMDGKPSRVNIVIYDLVIVLVTYHTTLTIILT